MSRFYIILSIALIVLLSSCGGKKQEPASDPPPCFSGEAIGVTPSYGTTTTPSSETSTSQSTLSGSVNCISTMSREEDAYEEGRALREEDRLNGTRQHEGDDYDEDYGDDYDEGYDE